MEWVRGELIGCGCFSSVNKARPAKECFSKYPPLMAVKSCNACDTSLLENERDILSRLGFCPQIIQCFGDDYSVEKNGSFYNLLLEYAAGGSLAHCLKKSGGSLKESDVKTYTRSILKGLRHIHGKGFVHCDLKLENILLCEDDVVKIADFGLSKKAGDKMGRMEFRGTPLYMSPESVNDNEYEAPCDVWAFGCAVLELMTGKPAWNVKPGANMFNLLIRIGCGEELPVVSEDLPEAGKDFLSKCLVKDPRKRWTAAMLLDHPFVAVVDQEVVSEQNTVRLKDDAEPTPTSPRGPFDFPEWVSSTKPLPKSESLESLFDSLSLSCLSSPADRLRQMVSDRKCNWADSGSWVTVR